MIRTLQVHTFPLHVLQGSLWKPEINSAVTKTRFSQLSAENHVKCDRMCVFHMMFYAITKKKCSPFSWYKTGFVWFSQFIMTVVHN